jgi:hypothetical protein
MYQRQVVAQRCNLTGTRVLWMPCKGIGCAIPDTSESYQRCRLRVHMLCSLAIVGAVSSFGTCRHTCSGLRLHFTGAADY